MTSMHRQLRVLIGLLFILALLAAGSVHGAPSASLIYVNHEAEGNNDGSSWDDAYTDLQDALGTAQTGDEIWVAQGVYYPAPDALDRNATFELADGVGLYGGFAGTETQRDERNWETNITVLSGDLDRNDTVDENGVVTDVDGIVGDNACTVVTGSGIGLTAVLDGFVVTGGLANTFDHNRGGGMRNSHSSPTLINVTFTGNRAGSGGGMHNSGSSPALTNVSFVHNNGGGAGGGMYNGNESNPTLIDVTLSSNQAQSGGGMMNSDSNPTLTNVTLTANWAGASGGGMRNSDSSPTLTNVTFTGNQASHSCGGMYNGNESNPTLIDVTFTGNQGSQSGGGMRNTEKSSPTLTNVTFIGNQADRGGGMLNGTYCGPTLINVTFSGNAALTGDGGGMLNWDSSPTLINVTFSGNQADHGSGGGMYNAKEYYGSSPTLVNSILWGNAASTGPQMKNEEGSAPSVTYSLVEGGYPGEGNIDADPLFVNPISADQAPTIAGDYRLTEGSPAIDAGTNDVVTVDTDLDMNSRVVDGTGDGNAIVDMGAYELQIPLLTVIKQGEGLVTGTPGPIDCGSVCTGGFLPGTEVTLTATADTGWTFEGWSGDIDSTANPLELTIEGDTTLTATFEPREMKVYLPLVLANR